MTVIVFTVVRFTGDPAVLMSEYPGVWPADLAAMRTLWGLDDPYTVQCRTTARNNTGTSSFSLADEAFCPRDLLPTL